MFTRANLNRLIKVSFPKQIIHRYNNVRLRCTTTSDTSLPFRGVNIIKYINSLGLEYEELQRKDALSKFEQRRVTVISHVVEVFEQRKAILENIVSLSGMDDKDDEMKKLIEEETNAYRKILSNLDEDLIAAILAMDDSEDYDSLILEVTAGVGGQEAMLFTRELFDMYCNYVDFKGWDADVLNCEITDIGGVRHATAIISGADSYNHLRHEGGVHRVQRIPSTEKAGRMHTSTVSVAIIPRPDDLHINIAATDLKIETKRASGAGGQHVNTTDSAVRMVHIPTGIAVECQSERSQIKNRETALKKLEAKLWQQQANAKEANEQATRKSQVGMSLRNEKIRTYNFSQDRVTDHRVAGGTVHNLAGFLEGGYALEDLINKVRENVKKRRFLEIINNQK